MNEARELTNRMRAITISREYGSGGGEIASRLARRLGWDLIDHAIVERTARALDTSLEVAEAHDESVQGLLAQTLNTMQYLAPTGFVATAPETWLSDETYRQTVERIIRAAAFRGQVVIVGRASQMILADRRDVMHVRVIAPLEQRVASVMQREGVDRHAAAARIHRKEHEWDRYLEREYHRHPDEAQLYDLVVNTARLDLESAVALIACTLHEIATGLVKPTSALGPVTGLTRYPAPPADFPSQAR